MSEPFLEEQLRRIRLMTERIAEARSHQQELSRQIESERVHRYDREHRALNVAAAEFSAARDEHERKHMRTSEPLVRRRASAGRRGR